jgi:hypothetical protein
MPLTFDWLGVWYDQEKMHIYREVVRGYGTRTDRVSCEVGRTADGNGITIALRGTPKPASILGPGGEWEKPGVIEKMVRQTLAGAEDDRRVERSLLGQ